MKQEISSAVTFLVEFLSSKKELSYEQIELFRCSLEAYMTHKFKNHWHPESPLKGNAFRCLNVDSTAVDPLLRQAACTSQFSPSYFQELFPDGLALWVDPKDVCCRIGKRFTINTIYKQIEEPTYPTTTHLNCSPKANYAFKKNPKYNWYSPQYSYFQTTQVY